MVLLGFAGNRRLLVLALPYQCLLDQGAEVALLAVEAQRPDLALALVDHDHRKADKGQGVGDRAHHIPADGT